MRNSAALALEPIATPTAGRPCLDARVLELRQHYARLWWETSCEWPALGDIVPRPQQRDSEREALRLIDELVREVEACPDGEDRALWRRRLQARVRRFGAERLGWPAGYQGLLFADEFYEATVEFVRRARAFDAGVRGEDVTQALRNVWIVNSLQMLLGLRVWLAPSVFAYSMLYPWTDNVLDDPSVGADTKAGLNERLSARLAGTRVLPQSEHERQVFRLVEMIEEEYDRGTYPEVYASLLAIHGGQVRSLRQQGGAQPPYLTDLLGISIEKGGTSVLVDGYLAAGWLSGEEADFAFGYGVVLQLLDDLQDVGADRRAGHMTVFSQCAGRWPLDALASRLYHLVCRVIDESPRFAEPRCADQRDLIRRNCTFLLVGAVAENAEFFTRPFIGALEERWAFEFSAMRRLRHRAAKRYGALLKSLRRRRNVTSLFDLL